MNEGEQRDFTFTEQAYYKPDERGDVGEWEYDSEMSNDNTAVWHNHNTKQSHLSNRGSTTAYDWLVSDGQILTGTEKYGSRFNTAITAAKSAHSKYGYNLSTSGHSLGGTTSNYIANEVGDEYWFEGSTTFNKGVSQLSGHRNQCNKPVPPPKCDKVMNLKITGDSVSQSNIVCDYVTFGAMPRLCNKQDALGQTKHLTRKEMRFYDSRLNPLRFWTRRAQDHSLSSFQNVA